MSKYVAVVLDGLNVEFEETSDEKAVDLAKNLTNGEFAAVFKFVGNGLVKVCDSGP